MKPLEKYIKADARVLRTRAAASDKLTITFETEDGDELQGSIFSNSLETALTAGDQIVVEYVQTEDVEIVKITSIAVKPRQRQVPSSGNKRFRIRRNRNIRPVVGSGYRCLFTNAGADGCIVRTFYLMRDNSLIINCGDAGTLKAWVSAREYIETHQSELRAAGRYDAIRLLEDELNRAG